MALEPPTLLLQIILSVSVCIALFQLGIVNPMGVKKIDVQYVFIDDVYIKRDRYPTLLVILDMIEFVIILWMDLLI